MEHCDCYLHIADFKLYNEAQERILNDFSFRIDWAIKSLMNISRIAKISSDRTIKEYVSDIWGIKPH